MPQWLIDWINNNKYRTAILVVAALCVIPYLSFQNMKARKARELNARTYPLDERVTCQLVVDSKDTWVVYEDGSRQVADALGVAVITKEDDAKAPDRLRKNGYTPKAEDFPLVVFFNRTGFDATGNPVTVRKASDGSEVWQSPLKRDPLRAVVPLRAGGFLLYFDDGTRQEVDDNAWHAYLGVEPPPSPEQLDKMSDEELKAKGFQRMSKEEFEKLKKNESKEPDKDKEAQSEAPMPRQVEQAKGGLKGQVVRVGDPRNPVMPLQVPVHVWPEDTKFPEKGQPAVEGHTPLATAQADKEGHYKVALPPGRYIVTIELDGLLYGNALREGSWPAVRVGKDWKSYDFRLPAR